MRFPQENGEQKENTVELQGIINTRHLDKIRLPGDIMKVSVSKKKNTTID